MRIEVVPPGMPNTPSAKKALRQSYARRSRNLKTKRSLKVAKKAALISDKPEDVSAAYKAIDKAKKAGLLKSKSAARHKSRLVKAINKKAADK